MKFVLTKDDVSPAIQALAKAAHDPRPVLMAMGTTFKSITEGNFNSVGASYRPRAWPAKVDGSASNLQSRHPTLSKSFQLTITGNEVALSNPMPYAMIHQLGGKTAPHRILPRKGKALAFGGKFYAAVNHPGSNIPARPFYPVIGGRLTPKAEGLIWAAAKRAFERQARITGEF